MSLRSQKLTVTFGFTAKSEALTVENDLRVIRSRLKSWIYCPKRVALDFWAVGYEYIELG